MYAGALGDNAVERYAMFFTSLELTADINLNERRLVLTCAREHGLNVHRVEVVTAERTIDRAFHVGGTRISRNSCAEHYFQLLRQMKDPFPSVIVLQATASDIKFLLLRSIEWTTFEDGTYDTALEQATVILRYFLDAGRVSLATNSVEMLPHVLASIDQPEERATDYLHYRQVFTIWDSLDRVVECQSLAGLEGGGSDPFKIILS